jgi:heptaprenylglyceryl phosphate synthase
LGHQLLYLEAGSGAQKPISKELISMIKSKTKQTLVVGGGIRDLETIQQMQSMGVNLIVIGTIFEENPAFIKKMNNQLFQ